MVRGRETTRNGETVLGSKLLMEEFVFVTTRKKDRKQYDSLIRNIGGPLQGTIW